MYMYLDAGAFSGVVTSDPCEKVRKRGPTLRTGELLTLLFCV